MKIARQGGRPRFVKEDKIEVLVLVVKRLVAPGRGLAKDLRFERPLPLNLVD